MSAPYSVTRAERSADVARLLAAGLTKREIAGVLGISLKYVRDLAWDPDGSKLRARVKGYEGVCKECGGPTRNGNNTKPPERCDPCYRKSVEAKHGTRSRYQAGCSCDECLRANREASRALKGKEPPNHGYSGYVNYGCRCPVCKDGHLVYMRSKGWEHQRAWSKRVAGTEPPNHGTLVGYNNYRCRCDECRRAMREYGRGRRAAMTASETA